ncbi:MAG: ArnT family glycosyltransferase [Bdellovibrionia bacterium]
MNQKKQRSTRTSGHLPFEARINPLGEGGFLKARWAELLPFLIYFLVILFVWPFGDYPLNDDWGYAYMVKQWAEKGEFRLFPPSSASLAGQVFFSGLIPYVFGFSHWILRLQSIFLGFLGIWLFRKLLQFMQTPQRYQSWILLCLVLNPLYFYFSTSFMSELYSILPVLVGWYLWFSSRQQHLETQQEGWVSWTAAGVTPILIGGAFWIRQLAALGYPALVAATLWVMWRKNQLFQLKKQWPKFAIGLVLFTGIILGHFNWVKLTHQPPALFGEHFESILEINWDAIFLYLMTTLIYLTAFYGPLLFFIKKRKISLGSVTTAGLLGVAYAWNFFNIQDIVPRQNFLFQNWQRNFPFWGNVLRNTGIGPLLLSDAYSGPSWPTEIWQGILIILALCSSRWIRLFNQRVSSSSALNLEIAMSGFCLALFSFGVIVQFFKFQVFDRYCFQVMLGGLVFLAGFAHQFEDRPKASNFLALLLLGIYTVFGHYDAFRLHDAKWSLYRKGVAMGIAPLQIDGGHEINGWTSFAEIEPPLDLVKCFDGWNFCHSRSYSIGMTVQPGATPILTETPFLLFFGRTPLYLTAQSSTGR